MSRQLIAFLIAVTVCALPEVRAGDPGFTVPEPTVSQDDSAKIASLETLVLELRKKLSDQENELKELKGKQSLMTNMSDDKKGSVNVTTHTIPVQYDKEGKFEGSTMFLSTEPETVEYDAFKIVTIETERIVTEQVWVNGVCQVITRKIVEPVEVTVKGKASLTVQKPVWRTYKVSTRQVK